MINKREVLDKTEILRKTPPFENLCWIGNTYKFA